jgi:hypothetical protein
MLGERMATGLNENVVYDSNEPVTPDGYLITDTGAFLVASNGDKFVYVQFP